MSDQKIYSNLVVKGGNTVYVGTDPVVSEGAAQTLTNKTLSSPTINTPTGITKSDVGLSNVDNTSDANKPISTATQTALNGKADSSHTHASTDITDFTSAAKSAVVDDSITDAVTDKAPSQNAVFDALAGKSNTGHGHAISDVTGLSTALGNKIESSEKGANNGVATLDAGGKVPVSQLPNSVMEFKGVFDPASATFTDAAGNAGDVWLASAAGSYDAGSGSITYAIGDWAVHNGSIFQKSLNSNSVVSVNGQTGVVSLSTDNVSEGSSNLYFTSSRAKTAAVLNTLAGSETDQAPSVSAVNTALSGKEASITAGTTSQYWRGDKSWQTLDKSAVGLGNLDNVQQLPMSYLDTDNTLAADSDSKVASQKATKAYVASAIGALTPYTADGQGIELSSYQFSLELDGSTLSKSSSGVKVASGGITNTEISSSAAIAYSKLSIADADLTIAKTSGLQSALDGKVDENSAITGATKTKITYDAKGLVTAGADATTDDIGEGSTNLYFTASRAKTAAVSDSITDGVTDVAPSQNAVFDALAGKANSSHSHAISDVTGLQTALNGKLAKASGDIDETSFSPSNNQSSFANITGLAFANATVRSFEAQVSVLIDATASKYEVFKLLGIQKGSSWDMSISATGDDSGYNFQITNAGQIQYTSPAAAGFNSATLKFRALTLSL
jgi:hypothetical protein